ncbi:MAG: hypothetical protein ACOY4H_04695 [Thermodesulfobacteriota bacterium]
MMKSLLFAVVFFLLFGVVHAGETRIEIAVADSPALGPADAPVTIIEFIDFQ